MKPTHCKGAWRRLQPTTTKKMATAPLKQSGAGRCLELALEGERLCRAGNSKSGITYLEGALAEGTEDLRTLSAIYSQLGNAYFYLRDYNKALEYHRHDVTLARAIGDRQGDAKASGNLGNTLKVLGKFDEAVVCCQRHLDIVRSLGDKVGEARALYNLGNLYHAKGKQAGRQAIPSSFADLSSVSAEYPESVRSTLQLAIQYYEANLKLVEEQNDKAAIGRACGNLGNTHYLLGQFDQAVECHNKRLSLAKEFGDKPAMRRAYSNLGNAHVFLGEIDRALEYYRKALAIAVELGDQAIEAQACYSLGNTSTLAGQHEQAVEYHKRHLRIARELKDRVGESRACFSLGNAFSALGDNSKALYFAALHYKLANEMGDLNGESAAAQTLSDLRSELGTTAKPDASADPRPGASADDVADVLETTHADVGIRRRRSMEHLLPVTAMNGTKQPAAPKMSVGSRTPNDTVGQQQFSGITDEEESFFALLSRVQGKRIDDQRCDPRTLADGNKENKGPRQADSLFPDTTKQHRRLSFGFGGVSVDLTLRRRAKTMRPLMAIDESSASSTFSTSADTARHSVRRRYSLGFFQPKITSTPAVQPKRRYIDDSERPPLLPSSPPRPLPLPDQTNDEFFDMIAGAQGRRMNDQRAQLERLPGLHHPERLLSKLNNDKQRITASASVDQMAGALRRDPQPTTSESVRKISADEAPAHALDEDFIDMLIRCQSTRIEEQRSELPSKKSAPTVPEDDIFQLVLKMQAGRFEEQRAVLDSATERNDAGPSKSAEVSPPNKQAAKRTASQKLKTKR
uniref:G-protein-signaling modulator 2 n=2 Tax=Plectus sambesii TaxID=2011161 RepID=A0A914VS42_9BILA